MGTRTSNLTGSLAMVAAILLLGGAGLASSASAGVEAREAGQRERIHRGVEDGSLTRREAHRLGHEQVRIERTERRFRHNDGHLGPRERVVLQRMQSRSSRHIARAKHNGRTR